MNETSNKTVPSHPANVPVSQFHGHFERRFRNLLLLLLLLRTLEADGEKAECVAVEGGGEAPVVSFTTDQEGGDSQSRAGGDTDSLHMNRIFCSDLCNYWRDVLT